MAAADIAVKGMDEYVNLPGVEVAVLTASDGETYVSKKFNTILGAIATSNSNNDADLQVTFSSQTATIHYAGQTDKTVTLVLFGRP